MYFSWKGKLPETGDKLNVGVPVLDRKAIRVNQECELRYTSVYLDEQRCETSADNVMGLG